MLTNITLSTDLFISGRSVDFSLEGRKHLLDHLSHSTISLFDCPYKAQQIKLLEKIKDKKNVASLVGSTFHDTIAEMYRWCQFDKTRTKRRLKEVFFEILQDEIKNDPDNDRLVNLGEGDKKKIIAEGQGLVDDFFSHHSEFLREPHVDSHGSFIERELRVKIHGVELLCYIDAVFDSPEGLVIVDWKSNKKVYGFEPQREISSSNYHDQLTLYNYVLNSIGLKVSHSRLVFLRFPDKIVVEPNDERLKRQELRVKRVVELIKKHDDRPDNPLPKNSTNSNCMFCPLKDTCDDAYGSTKKLKSFKEKIKRQAVL